MSDRVRDDDAPDAEQRRRAKRQTASARRWVAQMGFGPEWYSLPHDERAKIRRALNEIRHAELKRVRNLPRAERVLAQTAAHVERLRRECDDMPARAVIAEALNYLREIREQSQGEPAQPEPAETEGS